MLYIILAILMFGILIATHELGHFIAAKLCGVRVNEFAIGMGPRLLHRQLGETEYSLRVLPIGGFCAMEGEDEASEDPRAFHRKPAWKRFLILVSGAGMNFLTGVLIFLVLFSGTKLFTTTTIAGYMDGFQALEGEGLIAGDQVLSVDGHAIWLYSDLALFLERSGDDPELVVRRDGRRVELGAVHMPKTAVPNEDGTVSMRRGIVLEARQATLGDKLRLTWFNTLDTVRLVWMSLGDLVTGRVSVREVSGVIGIVDTIQEQAAQDTAQYGTAVALENVVYFMGLIAINLAVMNLLPIPALDGGQILFLLVDKIYHLFSRRHINQKYLGYINAAGLICLMGVMVLVAFSDIFKIFGR